MSTKKYPVRAPYLALDGVYRARNGLVVKIVELDGGADWPFRGDNGITYDHRGFEWEPKERSERDLISEEKPGVLTQVDIAETIAPRRDPKEKDTNPKAAIGVRKQPFSVIPMDVVAELGNAMLEGSAKYGRHNYRAAGARASVYFDGTLRHLVQWWEGQDIDPDSDVNHVSKAIASLVVLRAAMLAGKFEDDRPPRVMTDEDWERSNAVAAAIIDKHSDKTPKHYTQKDSE